MKLLFRLFLAALLLLASNVAASESRDFSGSYNLTKTKGGAFQARKGTDWTLDVVQSATAVQVTKVRNGRRFLNVFPLNGTEGVYNDPSGVTGKCKGHFRGRYLYLDSLVMVRPKSGPTIQGHTIERWELSADMKTLTIHTDVETTNADTHQILGNNVQSWSDVYTRN